MMHPEVETYITAFPEHTQQRLRQLQHLITQLCPTAVESINYGMPAYKLNGKPLVYFGGYKNHIGLYATPSGHQAFEQELAKYKQGKGSVQFPLTEDLPLALIESIVLYKKQEIEKETFANTLPAPARRALANAGIDTYEKLATYSPKELLALHGFGPSAIPKLEALLSAHGLI